MIAGVEFNEPLIIREMTAAERRVTAFDPSASPQDRLMGVFVRHLIDSARYNDSMVAVKPADIPHIHRLIDASYAFTHGMAHHFTETYGEIDVCEAHRVAQEAVIAVTVEFQGLELAGVK